MKFAVKHSRGSVLAALAAGSVLTSSAAMAAEDGKLRIICFGAHPDDCEIAAGGTAALWARQGHRVKFVSVTNGDIGHWREAGGPLFLRRKAEVEAAAKVVSGFEKSDAGMPSYEGVISDAKIEALVLYIKTLQ